MEEETTQVQPSGHRGWETVTPTPEQAAAGRGFNEIKPVGPHGAGITGAEAAGYSHIQGP